MEVLMVPVTQVSATATLGLIGPRTAATEMGMMGVGELTSIWGMILGC